MSRLLIVEDEEVLADSLQDILEHEGYAVRVARNGKDALDAIRQEPPELLVLDLMLPLVEGVDVLRGLRGVSPSSRVVITTSCSRGALKGESVDAFLRKPFTLDALLDAIRDALQQRSE
jgi:DNA-binding response OmpR family regulator